MGLNRFGFTAAEILVGLAIMGVLSIGVGALVRTVMTHQRTIVSKDEVNSFVSSFTTWVTTDAGCMAGLAGKRFPGSSPEELAVTGYEGYGMSELMSPDKTIKTGFKITPQLTLSKLTWWDKGVAPATVMMGPDTFERRVAQVQMEFAMTIGDMNPSERVRIFEVPLYIDPPSRPGKVVRKCFTEMTADNVCAALGNQVDPVTGNCRPQTNCAMAGTYKTLECSPSEYGCENASGEPLENPVTSRQTCPMGAVATQTGVFQYTHDVSCGKKCTLSVHNTMKFFVCMACVQN